MKIRILTLALVLCSFLASAADTVFYGAWWDVSAKGAPKQAGQLIITLQNFGNEAAVGIVTILGKQNTGVNTGTVDDFTAQGMWTGQKNANVVKIKVEKVLTYDTEWIGTLNLAQGTLAGTFKNVASNGRFQTTKN